MSAIAIMNNERVRVFNLNKTIGIEFWASDFPFDRGMKAKRNWVSFQIEKIFQFGLKIEMDTSVNYYKNLSFKNRRTVRQLVVAVNALFDLDETAQ